MKVYLIALATVTVLSAAPAYAAYTREPVREQARQERMMFPQVSSQLSEHCREVLSGQGVWGTKEIEFCRDSVL
jgi:hypothetical protein